MTVAVYAARRDDARARGVDYDPTRDKSYRATGLGGDIVDFLAWCELGGMSPRTLDSYERDLARGALMYPSKGIADITGPDMLHIAKTFKPKERRVRVAAYKSFFKWGRRTRRVAVNPCEELPDFKRPTARVYDIFTPAEATSLLALPSPAGARAAILVDAGLRKAEARHLQARDFRPHSSQAMPWGSLVVRAGKGGKDREIRCTRRLAAKLQETLRAERLGARDHWWWGVRANAVWAQPLKDRPCSEARFAELWRDMLAQAGVRYREPHMARHTFATVWLRNGGRLERLKVAMGHASIRTTSDLYSHLDAGDVAEDLALIEERTA